MVTFSVNAFIPLCPLPLYQIITPKAGKNNYKIRKIEGEDTWVAGVQQAVLPHGEGGAGGPEEESQSGEEPQDCQEQEAQHPR